MEQIHGLHGVVAHIRAPSPYLTSPASLPRSPPNPSTNHSLPHSLSLSPERLWRAAPSIPRPPSTPRLTETSRRTTVVVHVGSALRLKPRPSPSTGSNPPSTSAAGRLRRNRHSSTAPSTPSASRPPRRLRIHPGAPSSSSSSTPTTSALCRRWRGQIRCRSAIVSHATGTGRCARTFSVDPSLSFASKKSHRRLELR